MRITKAQWVIAILSLAAAGIHLYVVPEHLEEYPPSGYFFIIVGLLQILAAVWLLWKPSKPLYIAMVASTVALLALWVESRTFGLPMGAHWMVEEISLPDVLARVVELSMATVLLGLLRRQSVARSDHSV